MIIYDHLPRSYREEIQYHAMQENSLGFEKVQHNNSNHRSFLKPGQSDVTIDTSAAI